MAKRQLKNKTSGKTYGRSWGPLVWEPKLGRMTTTKIAKAIKENKS